MSNYNYKCVFVDTDFILNDYINYIRDGYVNIKTYNEHYAEIFTFLKNHYGENEYLDCEYGRLLFEGLGCKEDRKEAYKIFLKLADGGFSLAQYYLGLSYNCQNGIEKDEIKSYQWFLKSYENNCMLASYGIGFCYKKSLAGLVNNDEISMLYFMIAICNGNYKAVEKFKTFYDFKDMSQCNYNKTIMYLDEQINNGNKMAHIAKALFYKSVYNDEADSWHKIYEQYSSAPKDLYGFGYEQMALLRLPILDNVANIDEYILYIHEAAKHHNKSSLYALILLYLGKSPANVFLQGKISIDKEKAFEYLNEFVKKFKLNIYEKYELGGLCYDFGYIEKAKEFIKYVYDEAFKALKDKSYPNRFSVMSFISKDGEDGYFAKFNLVTAFNKKTLGIEDEIKCPHCNKKLETIERKTFFGKKTVCKNCKKEIKN